MGNFEEGRKVNTMMQSLFSLVGKNKNTDKQATAKGA